MKILKCKAIGYNEYFNTPSDKLIESLEDILINPQHIIYIRNIGKTNFTLITLSDKTRLVVFETLDNLFELLGM